MAKEPLKQYVERKTFIGAIARMHRKKKLRKKYVIWQKTQGCDPMPNYGKQQVVIEYINKFGLKTFIETGTYKGKMVYAVMPYVNSIYSVELAPVHCRRAQERFAGYPYIHIIHGQSGEVLPQIMTEINEPCLFWLDAHYSGGSTAKAQKETPIAQEIECIVQHKKASEHIILIDDARCFVGKDGYPTIDELEQYVINVGQGLGFRVENDIIRIHTEENQK